MTAGKKAAAPKGPRHHLADELLLDYASGSMSRPFAVLAATHLTLCPRCRHEVEMLEVAAGALFASEADQSLGKGIVEAPLSEDLLAATLARLDEPEDACWADAPPPPPPTTGQPLLPRALADLVGADLGALRWSGFGSYNQAMVLPETGGGELKMLKIAGGAAMPSHTHEGLELTLVLAGGFADESDAYLPGDLATADETIEHRPVADPGEDCLCLVVDEGAARLTGPVGRLLNPLLSR